MYPTCGDKHKYKKYQKSDNEKNPSFYDTLIFGFTV